MEQISQDRAKELQEFETKLGVPFLNRPLLNQSLTHSSFGHEKNQPDNERLEFLGDAVLKLVATEYLYKKFPDLAEGDLTKIRAAVISDESFSRVGLKLNIGNYLLLSANEKKGGGSRRRSNLANAFEAVVGAVYLDAGLSKVRDLIIEFLREEIEIVSSTGYIRDYKSALQELAQKTKHQLPHYHVIKESGPRHRRVFWIEVKVKGKRLGIGRGGNKKEAEQRAAAMALKHLKGEEKTVPATKPAKHRDSRGLRALLAGVRKRMKMA